MRAPTIPSIDEGIADLAELFREQIAQHFESELADLDDEQRSLLIDGILVLTSYDSFTIHLRLLRSETERIRAAGVAALAAILN